MDGERLILECVRIARPGLPPLEGTVVLEDGLISAVQHGRLRDRVSNAERVDCRGGVLFPGFEDPHCHPLALGSALLSADCRPSAVPDIAGLRRALTNWSAENPGEPIVRGSGYDELALREGRHPDRGDLDAAVADRPVVLTHSSGHAHVLNTAALRLAGITAATDEPDGGYIDREPGSGEPSGLLLEMSQWLDEHLTDSVAGKADRYARAASTEFLRNGVTSVTDAGHLNDVRTPAIWERLASSQVFVPRVTAMIGYRAGAPSRRTGEASEHGTVKVMLTLTGGRLEPGMETLAEIIAGASKAGSEVAVHAVEREAIMAVCETVRSARGRGLGLPAVRIEHASECPAEVSRALKAAGVKVVTQPGFIFARGDRYLTARTRGHGVPARYLYPFRRWQSDGVPVVASSDAPFGPVSPLVGIGAAATRRTTTGKTLAPSERIPVADAMKLYLRASGSPEGGPAWLGLNAGQPADLALLDSDPQEVAATAIGRIKCLMTVVSGQVAWTGL